LSERLTDKEASTTARRRILREVTRSVDKGVARWGAVNQFSSGGDRRVYRLYVNQYQSLLASKELTACRGVDFLPNLVGSTPISPFPSLSSPPSSSLSSPHSPIFHP